MTASTLQATDPPMLRAAFGYLGMRETPGAASNPRVLELYALAGHPEIKDDAVAWCAAFVGACAVKAGFAGSNSLAARSYLNWGQRLDTTKPLPRGAVLVFRRGDSAWQGHVCLLLSDDGATLLVIGGNQSDAVTIARFSRGALIGARKPLTITNSNVVGFFSGSLGAEGGAHAAGETAGYLDQAVGAPDPVTGALTEAQQLFQNAAAYLKYAQYALIAIGFLIGAYAIYRYARAWMKPKELPEIPAGEGAVDLLEVEDPAAAPAPRRRAKPASRAKRNAT